MSRLWTIQHLQELEEAYTECLDVTNINDTIRRIGNRQVVEYVRQRVMEGSVDATTHSPPRGYR